VLTTTGGGKTGLNWSADGKRLAYASQGGIWVVDAAGGPPRRLTNHPPGAGDPRTAVDRAPKWSPRGTWILFESGRRGQNDLMLVSDDGTRTNLLADLGGDASAASWSPDGQRIAYVERATEYFSGALKVMDIDTVTGMPKGEARTLYRAKTDRGGGWQIREPVWSPDGTLLAVVLQDSGWDKIYLSPPPAVPRNSSPTRRRGQLAGFFGRRQDAGIHIQPRRPRRSSTLPRSRPRGGTDVLTLSPAVQLCPACAPRQA